MKASRSFGHLAAAMLSMSTVASAWPKFLPDLDAFIVRRADASSASSAKPTDAANTFNLNTGAESTSTPEATATATGTKATGKTATTGTNTNTKATTGKTTAKATTTGKTTGKETSSSKNTTRTSFDAVDAAGGITMMTPSTVSGATQLYKIGDYVTWVWNYTSLQGTPTALDVLVSCSFATSTYTLTTNMTYETIGSYTWDTAAYETEHANAQLLTQEYTLIIYDADSSMTAAAEAGYLDTFDSFTFGLYATQSYTSIADGWTCAACSGAVSDMEKRALGFAMTMSIITIFSFTWFVTGMRLTL